ncbi:MAG: hypothetical protein IKO56_07480, partial [Alphaproteobacteria bacterium]|nr:hypothetical protein [Alphaproteobacteria bacterium]
MTLRGKDVKLINIVKMTKTAKTIISIVIFIVMIIILLALNASKMRNGGAIGGLSLLTIFGAVGVVSLIWKQPTKYKVSQTTKPNIINKHDAVSHYADLQSESPQTTIPMQQDKTNLISAEYSTENYKERLKRLCHPQNFINNDNYDKDKVAYANSIYTELFR